MAEEDQNKPEDGSRSWGAKFPEQLAKRIQNSMELEGYFNVAEFLRDAVRDKCTAIESKQYRRILEYFITSGKINVVDMADAIHDITGRSVPG